MYDYYGNGRCILWILPTNMPMHILGMPVFVDYYSVHDPVAGTVDWAPHTNSPKDTVASGAAPTDQFLVIGEVEQQSTTELLLEYAIAAAVCYGAIYYWQQSVYTYLTLEENEFSEEQVKLFSGGYFLVVAIVYYYAIQPVYGTIADTASGTASSSARTSSSSQDSTNTVLMMWVGTFLLAAYMLKKKLLKKASSKQEKTNNSVESSTTADELLNQLE